MAAALVPPTKSAHLTYEICIPSMNSYEICPSRPTKNAYPTYKKCPSDLRKMSFRPTKSAHPTYDKCPSDLQKVPI